MKPKLQMLSHWVIIFYWMIINLVDRKVMSGNSNIEIEEFCFIQSKRIDQIHLVGDYILMHEEFNRIYRLYNWKSGHLSSRHWFQEQIFPNISSELYQLKYVTTFDLCQLAVIMSPSVSDVFNSKQKVLMDHDDNDNTVSRYLQQLEQSFDEMSKSSSNFGNNDNENLEDKINRIRKVLKSKLTEFETQLQLLDRKLSGSKKSLPTINNIVGSNGGESCGSLVIATFCQKKDSFENQLCRDDSEQNEGCWLKTMFYLYVPDQQKKFRLIMIPFKLKLMSYLLNYRGLYQMSDRKSFMQISSKLRCRTESINDIAPISFIRERLKIVDFRRSSLIGGFSLNSYDLLQNEPGYLEYLDGDKIRLAEFLNCFENSTILKFRLALEYEPNIATGDHWEYSVHRPKDEPLDRSLNQPKIDYSKWNSRYKILDSDQDIKSNGNNQKSKSNSDGWNKRNHELSNELDDDSDVLLDDHSSSIKKIPPTSFPLRGIWTKRVSTRNPLKKLKNDSKSSQQRKWNIAAMVLIGLLFIGGCYLKSKRRKRLDKFIFDSKIKKYPHKDKDKKKGKKSKKKPKKSRKSRRQTEVNNISASKRGSKTMNSKKPSSKATDNKQASKFETKLEFQKKSTENYDSEFLHENVIVIDPNDLQEVITDQSLTCRIDRMLDESKLISKIIINDKKNRTRTRSMIKSVNKPTKTEEEEESKKEQTEDNTDQFKEELQQNKTATTNEEETEIEQNSETINSKKKTIEQENIEKQQQQDSSGESTIQNNIDHEQSIQISEELDLDEAEPIVKSKDEELEPEQKELEKKEEQYKQQNPFYSKLEDENAKFLHILQRLRKSLR